MRKLNRLAMLFFGLALVFGFISCKPEVEYLDKTYAAAPTFTISQNENGTFTVAIACATEGATIYYSRDSNTKPATEYKFAIEGITSDTYLSAMAKKAGIEDSPVSYAKISVKEKTTTEYVHLEGYALAPTFTTSANAEGTTITVTMVSATQEAKIYYTTDGSAPTTGSSQYTSAVTIDKTTTFKALAVKEGLENSPVSTATLSLTKTEVEVQVEKEVYISSSQTNSPVTSVKIYCQTADGANFELVATETANIPKDTALSDIAEAYKYEGFSARAMTQNGAAVNLFYERNLITLTFLINSGDTQAFATKTGLYGAPVESPADPSSSNKAGYHFNYWTTTGVTQVSLPQTFPAKDVTYIANWHAIEHFDVTYTTAYGTAPATKVIDCHTPLTEDYLPDLGAVNIQTGGKRYFRYWKDSKGTQVVAGTQVSADLALTAEWSDVNFVGQKPAPDAVGDIVFSDGSATPYTSGLILTQAQKDAAVAIIFYNGSESDVLGAKLLGFGIHNSQDEEDAEKKTLPWAYKSSGLFISEAEGNKKEVPGLTCEISKGGGETFVSGIADNVIGAIFSDAIDGSSSWTTLCEGVADENSEGYYPAWQWVNSYAANYELTGDFVEGWYFPSIAELSMLSLAVNQEDSVISAAISCAGGTSITDSFYWSSNQAEGAAYYPANHAWTINFGSNKINYGWKYSAYSVLAIRAFE